MTIERAIEIMEQRLKCELCEFSDDIEECSRQNCRGIQYQESVTAYRWAVTALREKAENDKKITHINAMDFTEKALSIKLPFSIGDTVYTFTQRSDTKTHYYSRGMITISNALYYKKKYDDGECVLTEADARAVVHELNALEKHSD